MLKDSIGLYDVTEIFVHLLDKWIKCSSYKMMSFYSKSHFSRLSRSEESEVNDFLKLQHSTLHKRNIVLT